MYNVENINETNTFVVKKDKSVRLNSHTGYGEPVYVPAGTILYNSWVNDGDITDEMLRSPKVRGSHTLRWMTIFNVGNAPQLPDESGIIFSVTTRPYQLRRATSDEVALCKQYAADFNVLQKKQLDEEERIHMENERVWKEKAEREQKELDAFKHSLKGKWTMFVQKVTRWLAVELIVLAGKANKEHIRTSELLQVDYDIRFRLEDDLFERLYGISRKEYERKFLEYMREGKDPYELNKKIFGNSCPFGSHCSPLFLALHMYR